MKFGLNLVAAGLLLAGALLPSKSFAWYGRYGYWHRPHTLYYYGPHHYYHHYGYYHHPYYRHYGYYRPYHRYYGY